MDLVAPNPAIMSTGFIQLGVILIVLLVAQLRRSTSTRPPVIWMKLNAPLVSIALGELWALASYALMRPVPTLDDYFIVGVWLAGGSGLVGSLMKDAKDGSMGTASVEGVERMRAPEKKAPDTGKDIGV